MNTSNRRTFLLAVLSLTAMQTHASPESEATAVVQRLLDAPQLAQYYHFDTRPQRKPLRIWNRTAVAINARDLIVCDEPVSLIQTPHPDALEITDLRVDDAHAQVVFSFPVEGVRGSASLSKQQGAWRIDKIHAAER